MKPRTLATRFLLIVALGAVLPLALVGLWLTRSAQRSGTALLRSQIERSADVIVENIDRRWTLRAGELQLLAANSVAPNVVTGRPISASDSAYLLGLAHSLSSAIPSIRYVDVAGREHWSFVRPLDQNVNRSGEAGLLSNGQSRWMRVELPVTASGRPVGSVVASVSVASVLAPGTGQIFVPGATVTIAGARAGEPLWTNAPESAGVEEGAATRDAGVEVASRTARSAPVRVTVSAPATPYVRPFEQAARTGLGILMAVALIALAVSGVMTRRVARSLEQLSDAASAVAAGDLQRTVREAGDDEIGQLARAFNAMTESLRRTVSELSQQRALAAVGEFAASLSHEVRNSLTAVRVDLQHAKRHLPNDGPGTPLVVRALDSVRRLDATVSGALRVARGGHVPRTPVELDVVLRRAMQSAEPSFVERGATLEPLTEQPSLAIDGDAAALEQLFLNLLINAAQASPVEGRVRVELQSTAEQVTIKVIDSGDGFAGGASSPIGNVLRTTKQRGTGLGLPIARKIAIAHGGELTFETGLESGTIALVRLPVPTKES